MFGPTDSGKAYTLKGTHSDERGLMLRAVEDLLQDIKERNLNEVKVWD